MENHLNSSEKAPIDRQEVINRLKDYGIEDETTRELFGNWVDQVRESADSITNREEVCTARAENEITIAQACIEAGYLEEAWDILNETIDLAVNIPDRVLVDRIDKLMAEIDEKLNSEK